MPAIVELTMSPPAFQRGWRLAIAKATRRLYQRPSRRGAGVCPPEARGDEPEQGKVQVVIAGLASLLGKGDQRRGPCATRCSQADHLVDPGGARPFQRSRLEQFNLT